MPSHGLANDSSRMDSSAANALQAAIYTALNKILRPIVRILLRNGIAYGQFAELARKVFVDVAATEFPGKRNKQTISHIAALTGLTRKEVKKMLETVYTNPTDSDKRYNRATRLISAWLQDPKYQDAQGQPAVLNIMDGETSFASLVRTHSGDMTIQSMLNLLVNAGTIKNENGRIRLITNAYIPGGDAIDKINILGNDVNELLSTIDHNLVAPVDSLRFQRKASNSKISASGALSIHKLVKLKAQALLEEIDSNLTEHEQTLHSTDAYKPGKTVSVGIYYYESDLPE
jgi:hypothetical protein